MKMKVDRLICYVALIFIGATGCDDAATVAQLNNTGQSIVGSEASMVADQLDMEASIASLNDGTGEKKSAQISDGGPSTPVLFFLPDMEKGKAGVKEFHVELENISDYEYTVSVRMLCSGLMNKSATLEMGEQSLGIDQTIFFSLNVESIPIQSLTNLNQARIEFTLTRLTARGESSSRVMMSAPFYFQHTDNYKKVSFFGDSTFMSEYQGILVKSPSSEKEAKERVIGRFNNGKGFEDVTIMDDAFATTRDGVVVARETGVDFSVGEVAPGEVQ